MRVSVVSGIADFGEGDNIFSKGEIDFIWGGVFEGDDVCLCIDTVSIIVSSPHRDEVQKFYHLPLVKIDDRVHNEDKKMKVQ